MAASLPPEFALTWLQQCIQPAGPVLIHPDAADWVNGRPHYTVEPYFASMGLYWAHRASPAALRDAVLRWLVWWFEHRSPHTGTLLCHYGAANPTEWRTTIAHSRLPSHHEDATDSNAALWYLLLADFVEQHGPAPLPATLRAGLHEPLMALLRLKTPDGLTWAKADYRVVYWMDNVEVWAGLGAAHRVLAQAGTESLHRHLLGWVAQWQAECRGALMQMAAPALRQTGLWPVSVDAVGALQMADLQVAYPDLTAQLWPVIFGFTDGAALAAIDALHPKWPTQRLRDDTMTDVHLALAACVAGRRAQVREWLARVAQSHLGPTEVGLGFVWPFTVAEAGMLHHMTVMSAED